MLVFTNELGLQKDRFVESSKTIVPLCANLLYGPETNVGNAISNCKSGYPIDRHGEPLRTADGAPDIDAQPILRMSVDVSQRRCSYRNTTGKMQGDIVFNDVGQLKCYSRMSVDVS